MRAVGIEPAPSRHETGDSTADMAPTKGQHTHTHTGTGIPQGDCHITPTGVQGVQVQIPVPPGEIDVHIPDMFVLHVWGTTGQSIYRHTAGTPVCIAASP